MSIPTIRREHTMYSAATVTINDTPGGDVAPYQPNIAETVAVDLLVTAHKYTASDVISDSAMMWRRYLLKNVSGTIVLVGSVLTPAPDQIDAGLTGISLSFPSAGNPQYTGLAATSIVWASTYVFTILSSTP
jgi:hypothetical protein